MLVSVDVLLTEAPMSGDRTRFYRTCEKIRSSPYIEKILRAVRIMVRKYENGMVVFETEWCCAVETARVNIAGASSRGTGSYTY